MKKYEYCIYACTTVKIDNKTYKAGQVIDHDENGMFIQEKCQRLQSEGYNVAWQWGKK
uniref:Uncharacterized protein n=1 Tax=viral metagenome TaxID=1070528 RepID=A0A6M3LNS1_9ZZZZ